MGKAGRFTQAEIQRLIRGARAEGLENFWFALNDNGLEFRIGTQEIADETGQEELKRYLEKKKNKVRQ